MNSAIEARTGKTIVVVEDDRTTAKILEIQLARLGYRVTHIFTSPREAIREINSYGPDLVVIGTSFPGDLDGIEAATILHGIFGIPVVFVTASTDQDTMARAEQARPSGYIIKPPDQSKLKRVLDATFSQITGPLSGIPAVPPAAVIRFRVPQK